MNEQPDQISDANKESVDVSTPTHPLSNKERVKGNRNRIEEYHNAKIIELGDFAGLGFIKLADWLVKSISRFCHPDNYALFLVPNDSEKARILICLYTSDNKYSITARLPLVNSDSNNFDMDHSYLGCIVTSRKSRAGEHWNRGRDLHDGGYNLDTWNGILGDIVGYELQTLNASI